MNKTIKTMALACTTVLLVAACEDLTEVTNVMPKDEVMSSLTTGDPSYVGSISARIVPSDRKMADTLATDSFNMMEYMTWKDNQYPILLQVSTNSSFPSDQTEEIFHLKHLYKYTSYYSGTNRYIYRNFQWQLSNLTPLTTYYYRECAVNNGSRVYGPTKQFTTSDYVHLSHIFITPWGSTEGTEQSGTLGNVGLFYGYSGHWFIQNSNNSLTYSNGRWNLPTNVSQQYLIPEHASSYRFYLYSPWSQSAGSSSNPYFTIDVSNAANDNIDYLWGRSEDGKTNAEASITMTNVLAKVTFVVTVQSDAQNPYTNYSFTHDALWSSSSNSPATGNFYITSGYISTSKYTNLLMRNCSFKYPDNKKELTFRVIPSAVNSDWWLRLMASKEMSASDYRAQIPSSSRWEAGKAYTYNVTISPKGMEIGDMTLEPWDVQPSDSLSVNN